MLSHHKFVTLLALLLTSVVLSAYIVHTYARKCIHQDPVFCEFIASLEKDTFAHTHGVFTTAAGTKDVRVNWVLNGQTKQITVVTGGIETMNMIATDKYVYVKDYRDGIWWQQPQQETEQYIVDLEFDPEFFISSVLDRLKDPNMRIQRVSEVPCKNIQCIRFAVGPESEANTEYVDITRGKSQMARYVGRKGQNAIAFNVHYETMTIDLPKNTKPAVKGQNIFLEQQLSDPIKQPAESLEFVQQFQQEMRESGK